MNAQTLTNELHGEGIQPGDAVNVVYGIGRDGIVKVLVKVTGTLQPIEEDAMLRVIDQRGRLREFYTSVYTETDYGWMDTEGDDYQIALESPLVTHWLAIGKRQEVTA
jgi:hypothetical protein